MQSHPSTAIPLIEGTSLHRRYSVRNLLGNGGGALTYEGFDYAAGQPITIVEFFPADIAVRGEGSAAVSPKNRESGELFFVGMDAFYRQYGKLMETIGSPNILSVFDVFFENGTAYAIAEQPDGATLSAYLSMQGRRLLDGELVYIVRSLTDALLVVHSCNILHHGITADCILLCEDGTVKLTDFAAGYQTVRRGRAVKDDEPWNDIRALGEALYRAYTGMPPVGPAHIEETVPHAFASMFTGMLSNRASLRFSSVFDLRYTTESLQIEPIRPRIDAESVRAYKTLLARAKPASDAPVPDDRNASASPGAEVRQGSKWVAVAVGAVLMALLGVLIWVLAKW